jgi:tellurite resistance protein TerC
LRQVMNNYFSHLSAAPTPLWIGFSLGVIILLIVDLSLFKKFSKNNHSIKFALLESALWIGLALAFNAWFAYSYGHELGIQFLTGYLVEKSLSVDNLFIILLIFSSFKVPKTHQHRALFYGVIGAIVLRAFFIVAGAQLLHAFDWVLYIFGLILVLTAIKFLFESDNKNEVNENWSIKLIKKIYPTTNQLHGEKFFVTENNIKKATPLFLSLIVIEVTDLVFAVDSIPAVFSVTQDAFVAFASNILAILGLRALYFVLADWVSKLRYLKPGLAAILGFIGIKMLIVDFYKVPSEYSLLVIFSILTTAGLSSWFVAKQEEKICS